MKKLFLACSLATILIIGGTAMAQQPTNVQPLLHEGVKEFGIAGNIDLESPGGGVDVDLNVRYGYFLSRNLEVGPFISFSRIEGIRGPLPGQSGDVTNYGFGAFADYHLHGYDLVGFARTVPFIGLSTGLDFTDTDFGEDTVGLSLVPRIGIKWFFRDYVAIDTNFYFAWASDDIYVNDGEPDNYDFGINIGLRVYFE